MARNQKLTKALRHTLSRVYSFWKENDCLPTSNDLESRPGERGRVVAHLSKLEQLGYIARPSGGRTPWSRGWLTAAGEFTGFLCQRLPEPRRQTRTNGPFKGDGPKFPNMVVRPGVKTNQDGLLVLKPGSRNSKVGGEILRGSWAGHKIYTLTLPERTTCPRACQLWETCYGNNMHRALRYEPGLALEAAVIHDLDLLTPTPIAVRLHVLGDFYSVSYARFWVLQVARRPYLRVFGFTAHRRDGAIGSVLADADWKRMAIRFSGDVGPRGASVRGYRPRPVRSFRCPEQRDLLPSCGACAACWETEKAVLFEPH